MHWAIKYLGRPWKSTGEGPDSFHCWSFFRWAQREDFGVDVPEVPNPENVLSQARAFRDHPERSRWDRVESPREGDAVLMRQARYPVHIGIWTDADGGKVVHCAEARGVEAPSVAALAVGGWRVEGFYRYKGDGNGGHS